MATLDSIQAKIAKLQAQAEAIVVSKSTVVLNKIRDLMDKHGISVADVDAHVGKRRGRKAAGTTSAASAAKYRDPKSGATWTGHGRAPQWIANAKDRNKFLVEGAAQAAAPQKAEAKRAGNYKRGPQPALYRDPKSGATWSGRGRAPAWIANAKDRTRFLIADADSKTVETPAAKKPATAKKGAAAKKAASAKQATAAEKAAPAKKASTAKKAEPIKALRTAKETTTAKKATVTKKTSPAKKATTARKAPTKKAAAANAQVQDTAIVSAPTENSVQATDQPTATA
ncbi:DNA-binding protein H-NS [Paraburkholderia bannensis]|uniref:DNA-binding protein H-NS n=1 Tax=Paraburkholderia bannensis TaxID=765414 RepID=A0A7W9U634_9BURK|nr:MULTISPECIES: H-NS family nucleoid-associated regulatory protein [Paraburkholderia]MBB3261628.1 DNA-binding protein H-NS [Paraburkholderia sp. WP4_3_2]MBB6106625.1 DNA-binding protein H-NS [Paraburkholderia bannensis]